VASFSKSPRLTHSNINLPSRVAETADAFALKNRAAQEAHERTLQHDAAVATRRS
jgi:hypothetical protein